MIGGYKKNREPNKLTTGTQQEERRGPLLHTHTHHTHTVHIWRSKILSKIQRTPIPFHCCYFKLQINVLYICQEYTNNTTYYTKTSG
jgi:hypothetical protein